MPVIPSDINAKVVVDSQTVTDNYDSQEMQTWKMVMDFLEQGKQARKAFDEDWDQRWDYYKDNQWEGAKGTYKSRPVMNIVRTTIQSEIPLLTDSRPTFSVLPQEPSDYEFADMCEKATSGWWDRSGMDHNLVELEMDAMVTDAGIAKIQWIPEAENNAGEIVVDVINPKNLYVPFGSRDFDKNCPWVVEEIIKTVGEVRRKYPDFADQVKADEGDKMENKTYSGQVTLVSPTNRDKGVNSPMPSSSADSRKACTLLQCWMDDDAVEDFEETNKETGELVKKQKMTYPLGRMIVILKNQKGIVLHDKQAPYKHGLKPYVRFVDAILPRSFWGEGEAKPLIHMQRILNKVLGNLMDHFNLMSNPIWKRTKDCGVSVDQITNKFGMIITTNPGKMNDIIREFPPAIQPGILDLLNQIMRYVETISGATDLSMGRKPTGVTAAEAINALQEAAQTRIRLKERNMQVSLSKMGKQVVMLMMQYYTEPRMTKITGKDGWPSYFEFFFSDTPDGTVVNKKKYSPIQDEQGAITGYSPEPNFTTSSPTKGIFDVKVQAGTSLPFAKSTRSNLALQLYNSPSTNGPAIDQESLLDTLEWPNKEQVIKRTQTEKQQAAAAQATMPPQ